MSEWRTTPFGMQRDKPVIALDALAGPAEVMEASGLTNRGSLDWAMKHRGFPQPVKILQRVRIWDLNEVRAWATEQQARD